MSEKRVVTERDFRRPDLVDANVEDYEFDRFGVLARKDRFEQAFGTIASYLGCGPGVPLNEIVVKALNAIDDAGKYASGQQLFTQSPIEQGQPTADGFNSTTTKTPH